MKNQKYDFYSFFKKNSTKDKDPIQAADEIGITDTYY